MKKLLPTLFVSAVFAGSAFALESYTVDPTHTYPTFEVSHHGYSFHRGRFNKTSGKITLDPAAATGSVDIVIDAASISTGLDKLEENLRSDSYFNVKEFPTIAFKSTRLNWSGDRITAVDGNFTLLGVTRPVTLAVDHFKCAPHPMHKKQVCGANATTQIKRSDFGMTRSLPAVGDDVKIAIQIEALKD